MGEWSSKPPSGFASRSGSSGDREAELEGLNWRVLDLLELGEMAEARAAIDSHARLAEELRLLSYVWYASLWRATLATMAGRLDEAAVLVDEGARIGRLARDENAVLLFGMQRMTLDVARDRLTRADRAAVEDRAGPPQPAERGRRGS